MHPQTREHLMTAMQNAALTFAHCRLCAVQARATMVATSSPTCSMRRPRKPTSTISPRRRSLPG